MPLRLRGEDVEHFEVRKIAVVGPGIVGMPMAAMLAHAGIREGTDAPAPVVVVQRDSTTSGWKVGAINAGRSPIGGIEPELDRIVADAVARGALWATHDYAALRDADVILVCVQTDKDGFAPDYGPLFSALTEIAGQLREKPSENVPLIIFESTLAPSSMATVIREHFAAYGLIEGRDILLGNSPNRVMPGRLVERVTESDKIVAGLHPATPKLIERLYRRIVTKGTLHPTNSLTAEVVKTLENAYRDVRIAYTAEVVRYCDAHDIDFYRVRDAVNARLAQVDGASSDPNAVPSGGLLIPTVGVGGHCLPKDGILLWWRAIESGEDTSRSLILEARRINDESPAETVRLAERHFGPLDGRPIALLGAAYRFNSEDTRNAPTLVLARQLLEKGCAVRIHDPFVKPDDQNLLRFGLEAHFTNDLEHALDGAALAIVCTGHRLYADERDRILAAPSLEGVVDGANLYRREDFADRGIGYAGIGRGRGVPSPDFIDFVHDGFRCVERGVANEVRALGEFLNERYAADGFNRVDFEDVRRIAGTCVTGCAIAEAGPVEDVPAYDGFSSRLVAAAAGRAVQREGIAAAMAPR
ncbi:MAG TPA: nucleotide sugar dehydrogenase [Longimicrobiales bacterium]